MRVESPSSINTFKGCKRKYYYTYIAGLPLKESLITIKGKIVHSVLENFFNLDPSKISGDNYEFELKAIVIDLLRQSWLNKKKDLSKLGVGDEHLEYHFEETKSMLLDWLASFVDRLDKQDFTASFNKFRPKTEVTVTSDSLMAKGIIDAVYEQDGKIILIDYKTSSNDVFREEHRLQLAIYALLYYSQYGKMPEAVGVNYLKFGERLISVNKNLLDYARNEIQEVHLNTKSIDIQNYTRNPGKRCKWSDGECDFFDVCGPFDNVD